MRLGGGPSFPGPRLVASYFFLFGRWVSAEAAADFAAGLDFGSRSTFDAADAAFALVTSLLDFAMMITSFRGVCALPTGGGA